METFMQVGTFLFDQEIGRWLDMYPFFALISNNSSHQVDGN